MTTTRLLLAVVGALAPAAARAADVPLPTGGALKHVDFERHIMGLLSKTGCNAGGCHGSFQGKNGFRLSLFGYEPAMDHAALTRDNLGRRVNVVRPDESLILSKAVGATAHDGGMRFGRDNWVYAVFRAWIAGGAKWTPGSGAITGLRISPENFAVVATEKTVQVKVTATFADGTAEDITPFCDFKISDEAIASVDGLGRVAARQPGDAGLTVLYRGAVIALRVLVPAPGAPATFPAPANFIDGFVFDKLRLLNMTPSAPAADEVFIRRVYIDTIAQLPPTAEVRAFVANPDPKKREKLIDKLLAQPLHAAVWATKLSDVTGNNTTALEQPNNTQNRRSQMWHEWLRKRVADNVPYDRTVRDILTANSLDGRSPEEWIAFVRRVDEQQDKANGFGTDYPQKPTLDLFWRRQQQQPVEAWGEKVAAAFLGVRLECAQCHKHPTDRWTQEDYWGFANIFGTVTFAGVNQYSSPQVKGLADKENAERKAALDAKKGNNQFLQVREVFTAPLPRQSKNPGTGKISPARVLGGKQMLVFRGGDDPRVALAAWVTGPENPFFARSFVNRVWAHYFGVGLVNPVDDFSLANPPTNAKLLDALAASFVTSGYDIRKLEKAVLTSRVYGLGFETTASNKYDKNNFSHAYIRPLMAEQVVDVLNSALGVDEQFAGPDVAPAGTKMVEVGSSRLNGNVAYALRIFGRPPRTTACDCERSAEPALPQTLFRMTDPTISNKLAIGTGRVQQLAKAKLSEDELVEEAFLATLSRPPRADEKAAAVAHVRTAPTRLAATTDLVWALINTREFILNH
ncbi:MAG TPA: DUF1549 domain-containing protein [Urbifossiella sp.]|jgi:hypothetical protein|nr:DUF1549 domain-containing protein [Urbifossiella sp.]